MGFTPLDRDLRSHFDHPPRRDLEIIRGVVGGAAEADEQQILPARHARMPHSDSTCGPSIASNPCVLPVKHQG